MYFLRHKLCEGEEVNTHYTPHLSVWSAKGRVKNNTNSSANKQRNALFILSQRQQKCEWKKEAKVCEIRRY